MELHNLWFDCFLLIFSKSHSLEIFFFFYERYFLTGDKSGLTVSKPRHTKTQEVEYSPQELKKGFSVNQTLNYLKTKFKSPLGPATDIMADIVANTFGQRGSKAILDDYTRNFVPALLSGKNVAGKTSGNPRNVGNMYSHKALNDFEKVLLIKILMLLKT